MTHQVDTDQTQETSAPSLASDKPARNQILTSSQQTAANFNNKKYNWYNFSYIFLFYYRYFFELFSEVYPVAN